MIVEFHLAAFCSLSHSHYSSQPLSLLVTLVLLLLVKVSAVISSVKCGLVFSVCCVLSWESNRWCKEPESHGSTHYGAGSRSHRYTAGLWWKPHHNVPHSCLKRDDTYVSDINNLFIWNSWDIIVLCTVITLL